MSRGKLGPHFVLAAQLERVSGGDRSGGAEQVGGEQLAIGKSKTPLTTETRRHGERQEEVAAHYAERRR